MKRSPFKPKEKTKGNVGGGLLGTTNLPCITRYN